MRKIMVLAGLAICLLTVGIPETKAQGPNCPNSWHPPPCGIPPPAVTKEDKEAAKRASAWHTSAIYFFAALGGGACALSEAGEKRAAMVCTSAKTAGVAAALAKVRAQGIINDPWDPNYLEAYYGQLLSYAELGFEDESSGDESVDFLIAMIKEHAQYGEMLLDRVRVSIDRYYSCIQAGIDFQWYLGCEVWQKEWADVNLRWAGERWQALAAYERYLADYLAQFEGMGVNPAYVDLLDADAEEYDLAGGVFQQ
jgi:hypothetical protein